MTSTVAFFARLFGLLAVAVATLSVAVGMLGRPAVQKDENAMLGRGARPGLRLAAQLVDERQATQRKGAKPQ